jgi:hypothetical protein
MLLLVMVVAAGCGGGRGGQVTRTFIEIQNQVKAIKETQGSGKGSDYSGTYGISLSDLKISCSNGKSTKIKLKDKGEMSCEQKDGALSCKGASASESDTGYVHSDGGFGLALSEIEEDGATGVGLLKGKLETKGTGSAEFKLAISGKDDKQRVHRCIATASMKLNKAGSASTNSSYASVSFDYRSNVNSGSRFFRDVRTQISEGGDVTIGAKGSAGEKFVARFPSDRNGSLQISVAGAEGISEPTVLHDSNCEYSHTDDQIAFNCPSARGVITGISSPR